METRLILCGLWLLLSIPLGLWLARGLPRTRED